jgi:AraC-like DNA-binding protein
LSDPSPALLSAFATLAFDELGVGASLESGGTWRAIHTIPSVVELEVECGNEALRWAYNGRCLARARATKQLVRGEHAGFFDFFAPIASGFEESAVLVVGPFSTKRPTSADVIERWGMLRGERPSVSEPAFQRYLSATLGLLTLEGALLGKLGQLVSRCAALLGRPARASRLAKEVEMLRGELVRARAPEKMWDAARSMVDDSTTRQWSTPLKQDPLAELGMSRGPEHAIVGLIRGRADEVDLVGEALRVDGYQRALTEVARRRKNVVAGRIGDRGITLLSCDKGRGAGLRADLVDLAAVATRLARQFGFGLHAGIARGVRDQTLSVRYAAALAAAERALSRSTSTEMADDRPETSEQNLSKLRSTLARTAESDEAFLSSRFEHYIETVAAHAGRRFDVVHAYLEAGFERLTEPLLQSGRLDQRSFDELRAPLARRLHGDSAVLDLLDGYRNAVADIERALARPTPARRDRSIRRALAFLREHLAEPLTVAQVARAAGFAPDYLRKVFRRAQGVTLDEYLQRLRLERAQQVLATSTFAMARVARLAGFQSRTYFQLWFRRRAGMTPAEYRRRSLGNPSRPYVPLDRRRPIKT